MSFYGKAGRITHSNMCHSTEAILHTNLSAELTLQKRGIELDRGLLDVPSLVGHDAALAVEALPLAERVGGGDVEDGNVVDLRQVLLDFRLGHARRNVQQSLCRRLGSIYCV